MKAAADGSVLALAVEHHERGPILALPRAGLAVLFQKPFRKRLRVGLVDVDGRLGRCILLRLDLLGSRRSRGRWGKLGARRDGALRPHGGGRSKEEGQGEGGARQAVAEGHRRRLRKLIPSP